MTGAAFQALAKVSQFAEGAMIAVAGGHGADVLLARVEGEWFAVSNLCSHLRAELHRGTLTGHRLACPLHGGAFDIRSGMPVAGPVCRPIETYPVRLRGDAVEVAVPEQAAKQPGFEW